MEPTKLITLTGLASVGTSTLSGSLISGSGFATAVIIPSPFKQFDKACANNDNSSQNVYGGLSEPEKKRLVDDGWTLPKIQRLNLPTPSSTDTVKGCLRLNYRTSKEENQNNGVYVTIEMTVFKGNYGIILLNYITNSNREKGWTSDYRAIFLEQSNSNWRLKGGVQWMDEAFTRNAGARNKKIRFSGLTTNAKEIDWSTQSITDDQFSVFWNPNNTKEKNIYQYLLVSSDTTPSQNQDFWNGQAEPLITNSSISKPAALFDGTSWREPSSDCCRDLSKFKSWFNLFNNDKGEWKAAS